MRTVFIGGCDRSGTTLLGSLLGQLEDVIVTPESQFKKRIIKAAFECNKGLYADDVRRLIGKDFRFMIWGVPVDAGLAPQQSYSPQQVIEKLVLAYGEKIGKKGDVWVDHTPENLRFLSTLFALFPDAHAIHIVRDGRAVFNSVRAVDWGPKGAVDAANWWSQRVGIGLAQELHFPNKVIRIRYEELVTNPNGTVRYLLKRLNLMQGKKQPTLGFEVSPYSQAQHRLVGQPPQPSRAAAWKRELPRKEVAAFEASAGAMLDALGYDVPPCTILRGATRGERLRSGVKEVITFFSPTRRLREERRKRAAKRR
jgi:hypothetical protein